MEINLQHGEEIMAVFRRHWILFIGEILLLTILFLLPILLSSFLPRSLSGAGVFFGALWMLALYTRAFIVWFKYYFDAWIVTNMRIVDVEQISLFNRKTSTLDPEHIEDVTIHVDGLIKNILGYGNLTVQTAGRTQEFIMKDIRDPEHAKQIVYEAQLLSKRNARREMVQTSHYDKRDTQDSIYDKHEVREFDSF